MTTMNCPIGGCKNRKGSWQTVCSECAKKVLKSDWEKLMNFRQKGKTGEYLALKKQIFDKLRGLNELTRSNRA